MSISAIHPSSYQSYSPSDKRASPVEEVYKRDTGKDTLSFSHEARVLAYGVNADEGTSKKTAMKLPDETSKTQDVKPSGSVPVRVNMLEMLMDAYLLATLAENEESAPNPNAASEQGGTQDTQNVQSPNGQPASTQSNTVPQNATKDKPSGVLGDGGKVSEIKQTINNFIMGKADISDVSKAMSTSSGSNSSAVTGATTAKKSSDGPKLLVV